MLDEENTIGDFDLLSICSELSALLDNTKNVVSKRLKLETHFYD